MFHFLDGSLINKKSADLPPPLRTASLFPSISIDFIFNFISFFHACISISPFPLPVKMRSSPPHATPPHPTSPPAQSALPRCSPLQTHTLICHSKLQNLLSAHREHLLFFMMPCVNIRRAPLRSFQHINTQKNGETR